MLPTRLWQKSTPQKNFTGKTNARRRRASTTDPERGAAKVDGSPRADWAGLLMSRNGLLKNAALRLRGGESHQAANSARDTDLVRSLIHQDAPRNPGSDQQREDLVRRP